jgi:hypothetical protein
VAKRGSQKAESPHRAGFLAFSVLMGERAKTSDWWLRLDLNLRHQHYESYKIPFPVNELYEKINKNSDLVSRWIMLSHVE